MLFRKKIQRAQDWLHDQSGQPEDPAGREETGEFPSMEELKAEGKAEFHLEKGDIPAMLLAALPIVVICLLVLLAICSFVFFL